jgi:hypothetical protein
LIFFRCRVGPPVIRWRRRGRWRVGRRHVAWAGTVLLMPSGLLRMFLTPVATGLPRAATVRPLAAEQARGLGAHPVSLLLTTDAGKRLEIAVPQAHAEDVVGPFLAAAFLEQPPAPREQGG